jgi:N4-gp56 family major capsid protein
MAILSTATTNFSKTVTDLIASTILDALRAGLPHLPLEVAVTAAHVKGTNGTFRFVAYPDFDPDTTSLTEGVAFPSANEQTIAIEYDDFVAAQKGGAVRSSDLALIQSPHDMVTQLVEKTRRHALVTIDEIAKTAWNTPIGGEVVLRPTGATSQATVGPTMFLNGALVRAAFANLAGRDVPRVGSGPNAEQGQLGGSYIAIAHPHVIHDLQGDLTLGSWIDASKYAVPTQLLTGEVGSYMGVRFISSTRATIVEDGGVTTTDVYRTFVAGRQAIAWADPASLMTSFIPPTPTKDDVLGQIAKSGWKAYVGGCLTDAGAVNGRYVVIETAASLGANT